MPPHPKKRPPKHQSSHHDSRPAGSPSRRSGSPLRGTRGKGRTEATRSRTVQRSEAVRLQKILADQGLCSRRQAEEWISGGRVSVNGKTAELGMRARPGQDSIALDGRMLHLKARPTLVVAVNKPRGYICSNSDPHHPKTIFDLVPPQLRQDRLMCAGRLDKDSEGLVILTNSGEFSQRLTHPSNAVIKRYRVQLDRPFRPEDSPKLIQGVTWEGERLSADKVIPFEAPADRDKNFVEIHLGHGRKREIRRLLLAFKYGVRRLRRFQIGNLQLKGIPPGGYRILAEREISRLFE